MDRNSHFSAAYWRATTATLYVLKNDTEHALKVGITHRPATRLADLGSTGWTVVTRFDGLTPRHAHAIEQAVLRDWRSRGIATGFVPVDRMPHGGSSETVSLDDVSVAAGRRLVKSMRNNEMIEAAAVAASSGTDEAWAALDAYIAMRGAQVTDGNLPRFNPNGPGKSSLIPAECGTYAGYQRHRRRNEEKCDDCRAANRARISSKRKTGYGEKAAPAVCGTRAGYNRHLKDETTVCLPCAIAKSVDERLGAQARAAAKANRKASHTVSRTKTATVTTVNRSAKKTPAKQGQGRKARQAA